MTNSLWIVVIVSYQGIFDIDFLNYFFWEKWYMIRYSVYGFILAIGMFFPPHMAFWLSLGGIIALLLEQRKGKEWIKARGSIATTALSVGATLTVPILILLNLFS